jgi:hypothetical protein
MRIGGVVGMENLAAAIARHRVGMAQANERALKKVGLAIQRHSQLLVPVEFGLLRNSAFTRHTGSGFSTVVTVGYTAAYSVYVHEILTSHHPIGQAKFLEQPVRERRPEYIKLYNATMGV